MRLLSALSHDNVVRLEEIVTAAADDGEGEAGSGGVPSAIYMVFEYCDGDLGDVLKAVREGRLRLTQAHLRSFTRQVHACMQVKRWVPACIGRDEGRGMRGRQRQGRAPHTHACTHTLRHRTSRCWRGCTTSTRTRSCTATSRVSACLHPCAALFHPSPSASLHFLTRIHAAANILVTRDCRVKIGDWGLGRAWSGAEKARYTDNVCTLWYRAPELLMGVANYTLAVDMWSIGCARSLVCLMHLSQA